MTDNNHPITPPPELVQQWMHEASGQPPGPDARVIATQAARWGADQELEACSQWIHGWYGNGSREVVGNLYAARRPKPPSLKEQAVFAAAVLRSPDETCSIAEIEQHWHTIRRALESLPE